jgi:hypothetical protein
MILVKYFSFMKLTLKMPGSAAQFCYKPLKKTPKKPMLSKMLALACCGSAALGEMEV